MALYRFIHCTAVLISRLGKASQVLTILFFKNVGIKFGLGKVHVHSEISPAETLLPAARSIRASLLSYSGWGCLTIGRKLCAFLSQRKVSWVSGYCSVVCCGFAKSGYRTEAVQSCQFLSLWSMVLVQQCARVVELFQPQVCENLHGVLTQLLMLLT